MVNEKPKKVAKKSVGKAESSSKKTVSKKKSAVKKKETTVQKKKSSAKKATTSKVIKPIAKKVSKKPTVKSKPKAKKLATKKPVKKNLKIVTTEENAGLQIEEATKTQKEKIEKLINKLSQTQEQHYVTTVPGVFRKIPAVQKTVVPVHNESPIVGILNYFKRMF